MILHLSDELMLNLSYYMNWHLNSFDSWSLIFNKSLRSLKFKKYT